MPMIKIERSCGHCETVAVFGDEDARLERIENLKSDKCIPCRAKDIDMVGTPNEKVAAHRMKLQLIREVTSRLNGRPEMYTEMALVVMAANKIKDVKVWQRASGYQTRRFVKEVLGLEFKWFTT